MSMKLDAREWNAAVKAFAREAKKDGVEAVNRSMESILYRAPYALLKRTYSQTKQGIQQSINAKYPLLVKLAAISLKRKGIKQTKPKLAAEARRIMAAKYKSAGYIVSGWVPAARAFGASRVRKTSGGGKVGQSYGRRATFGNAEALAVNSVAEVLKSERVYAIVSRQMQRALDSETEDLLQRMDKALAKTARKRSGNFK